MKSMGRLTVIAVGFFGGLAALSLGQGQAPAPAAAPAAAPQTGPGVQAGADSKFPAWVASKCKNPPAARGGGGRAPAGPFMPREYTVTEIPGVIAAGQKWTSVWKGRGNNADGILATSDGGILAAQNTDSKVMKIDKNDKVSFPYMDTNTGGALAMNKKNALFVVSRGLPQAILQLAPKRQVLANMYNGEPLECTGGGLNDLTADSKGGAYFTMGGLYYADPKGVITKYGTITGVNGIILSPDEKTLYVTGRVGGAGQGAAAGAAPGQRGGAAAPGAAAGAAGAGRGGGAAPGGGGGGGGIVAYDIKPDGSLTNERQFATISAAADGSTVDAAGRVYTTAGSDVHVIGTDGKELGIIPSPVPIITTAFSGPDKKTLYIVANNQNYDEIFKIQMIAQGYKGRAK